MHFLYFKKDWTAALLIYCQINFPFSCLNLPGSLGHSGHLFELSEEVSLERRFLGLLLPGEPRELSAAVRLDAHAGENAFVNAAENDIERPWQDTGISVWAWRDKREPNFCYL